MKKSVILSIIAVLGITIAGFYFTQKAPGLKEIPDSTDSETTSTIDISNDPSTTMASFDDPDLGFSIEYPADWNLSKQGKYTYKIMRKLVRPAVSESNFVMIQVIPKNADISDKEIGSFNRDLFNKLLNATEKIIVISQDQPQLNEYFTYEKQAPVEISGITAQTFVNNKPWEFPEGTAEHRYILATDNKYILLTAYIGTDTKDQFYIAKDEFQRIFNTLDVTQSDDSGSVGIISGKLCYPSQFLPQGIIEAKNVNTQESFEVSYVGSNNGGKSTYELKVYPGNYVMRYRAMTDSQEVDGYNTDVCPTGNEISCNATNNRNNNIIEVKENEIKENIDLCDFYYNENTKPDF